jgi:glycosyltransferase involved in cell wall biosynthesis
MRNVYLINLSLGLAGTERRFANIWHELRRRGRVRPILVVPDTLADLLYKADLAAPGDALLWTVREHPLFRVLSHVPSTLRGDALIAWLRSRRLARAYDVVWARIRQDPSAVIHIGLNCSSLEPADAPIVYECMDSTLSQLGARHYVKAAARPAVIHCQTERIRLALEQTMAARRPIWTTVSSPSYFASYPPEEPEHERRDPMLVAFVGRLSPEKSPLLFVEAIARVRAAGLPCRGLMLGQGPMLDQVQARIEELGLRDVVHVEYTARPVERLRSAAVFVSLQSSDNYGSQSLLEAMGSGCAVVATDVGETRRIVTSEIGRLVDFSVEALTDALATLLRDPNATARMGASASRIARTQYSADRYAEFLESLYQRAVEMHASIGSSTVTNASFPLAVG